MTANGAAMARITSAAVACGFILVQVRMFVSDRADALLHVGDGTLALLAFLGHAIGLLLAIAYGSMAFRRREAWERVDLVRSAVIALAGLALAWLYFVVIDLCIELASESAGARNQLPR